MDRIPEYPQFGWSWRRSRLYRECPRKYWWSTYGLWNGWDPSRSNDPAWFAYRLRHTTTFPLLVGDLAHKAMQRIAEAVRAGRPKPNPEDLYTTARTELLRVRNMERKDWLRAPKQNPALYERVFGLKRESEITDAMHEADIHLLRCIENGWSLSLWEEIAAAVKVLPPDKVQSCRARVMGDNDPIVFWGAPDVAWIHPDRLTVDLNDFKTSSTLDVPNGVLQIHVYAAWLLVNGGTWSPSWRGRLICLADGSEVVFPVTMAGLNEAFTLIEQDVRTWRLFQDSRDPNVAPMECFEKTGERWRCGRCEFVPVCQRVGNPGGQIGLPGP